MKGGAKCRHGQICQKEGGGGPCMHPGNGNINDRVFYQSEYYSQCVDRTLVAFSSNLL